MNMKNAVSLQLADVLAASVQIQLLCVATAHSNFILSQIHNNVYEQPLEIPENCLIQCQWSCLFQNLMYVLACSYNTIHK